VATRLRTRADWPQAVAGAGDRGRLDGQLYEAQLPQAPREAFRAVPLTASLQLELAVPTDSGTTSRAIRCHKTGPNSEKQAIESQLRLWHQTCQRRYTKPIGDITRRVVPPRQGIASTGHCQI